MTIESLLLIGVLVVLPLIERLVTALRERERRKEQPARRPSASAARTAGPGQPAPASGMPAPRQGQHPPSTAWPVPASVPPPLPEAAPQPLTEPPALERPVPVLAGPRATAGPPRARPPRLRVKRLTPAAPGRTIRHRRLGHARDLRRAIVLMAVLGPCRGIEEHSTGTPRGD